MVIVASLFPAGRLTLDIGKTRVVPVPVNVPFTAKGTPKLSAVNGPGSLLYSNTNSDVVAIILPRR